MKTEEHNRYQRSYYETQRKRTMLRTSSFYVRHKVEWMKRYADLRPEHAILEVGAGLGKFSAPLIEEGFSMTCLDLSPVMLEDLKAALPGRSFETVACDVLDVKKATSKRFDRVISFFTLHHLLGMDEVFRALASVMRPGGLVVFMEPAASNPLYYLQVTFTPGMTWRAERGIPHMRKGRVFPAMEKAGLTDLSSKSFGFLPPFLANTAPGRAFENTLDDNSFLRPFAAFRLFRGRLPS